MYMRGFARSSRPFAFNQNETGTHHNPPVIFWMTDAFVPDAVC
jgi:hypothetical protein